MIVCFPSHSIIAKSLLPMWASSSSHQPPKTTLLGCSPPPATPTQGDILGPPRGPACVIFCPLARFSSFPFSYFSSSFGVLILPGRILGSGFMSPHPLSLPPPSSSALSQLQGSVSSAQEQKHKPNRNPFPELLAKVFHIILCCFWSPLLQITFEQV